MIKVYRYEKEDKGGPYFNLNGESRIRDFTLPFLDPYVYGCCSKEALDKYFESSKELIKECKLKIYEISEEEIKNIGLGQIMFPKKYIDISKKI